MAQPPAFNNPYAQQNKGTLVAGQTISVNKYTVQVERYLSQGGFAHVYLVRTATPVYNTTHHVLKRIAVPNEGMLTEVKKEVDIMRILKGHPNIVHLIDAAWHRMPNGVYEVFILMEFCPGGGIIDMMNRRLRERLTEPEILTIFVDVCEGLAAMHALKPPLLHRDLKVENILQSSATSYKLCDFGSAMAVQKVPTTMQELRALEADLNKHTTLQYRAPEMVDVFQRRAIDEKSDVWALGVLLYKLCYYTTPFEEHGPLAILNVQYKIPPYPVYSNQMNALIASMLREHGAQRPTVFEILTHVHSLRGTKSRYTYNIAPKQPPMPPRAIQGPLQTLSSNIAAPHATIANPLDDLVSFKSRSGQVSSSPAKNAGIEARDKVLEAIAPMRRGRPGQTPGSAAPSPPPSPRKDRDRKTAAGFALDMKFGADEDKVWKGVRGHKSGMASLGGGTTVNLNSGGDAWGLSTKESSRKDTKSRTELPGFESDFSSFKGFGDTFEPAKPPIPTPSPSKPQPIPGARPLPSPGPSGSPHKPGSASKDAFDGLGLTYQPPPQTLGDARRARTGMAAPTGTGQQPSQFLHAPVVPGSGYGSSSTLYRPPSSHSQMPSPNLRPQSRPHSPASWRPQTKPSSTSRPTVMSAEERFPSLEDLDRTFGSSPPSRDPPATMMHSSSQPALAERLPERPSSRPPSRTATHMTSALRTGNLLGISASGTGTGGQSGLGPPLSGRPDGVRSHQVTGTAMRESRMSHSRQPTATGDTPPKEPLRRAGTLSHHPRPVQPRRHRSSVSIKPVEHPPDMLSVPSTSSAEPQKAPALPPRPSPKPVEPRDWLTGASDEEAAPSAVLRKSPSKRASFIEKSPIQLEKPLEAESGVMGNFGDNEFRQPERERPREERNREREDLQNDHRRAAEAKLSQGDKSRRDDRGRRSPTKASKTFVSRTGTGGGAPRGGLQLPGMETKLSVPPLSSSPSGLTDNWSPISSPTRASAKRGSSSSSDEGPEDLNGFVPRGMKERMQAAKLVKDEQPQEADKSPRKSGHGKGRQNSVHDLLGLWGGANQQPPLSSPTKLADKRRSAIVTSSSMMKPLSSRDTGLPALSPPLASPTPVAPSSRPSTPSGMARPPSTQPPPHRRQTSVMTGNNSRMLPPAAPASTSMTSPPAIAPTSSSERSRPQSMFINPIARTTPLETSTSSGTSNHRLEKQDSGLPGTKQRRSTRRTSITDMVQKFEAINGRPPPVAAKPAPLSMKAAASESSSTGAPSPSAAATRFPQLSPPSSPVTSKASLAPPEDLEPTKWGAAQGRRSPSPGPAPLARPLPGLANVKAFEHATGSSTNGLARRTSIRTNPPPPLHEEPPSNTGSQNNLMPPPTNNDVRSPSPERPYQGVSRLIDRWQKVADSNDTGRGTPPPKRPVASGSVRGR